MAAFGALATPTRFTTPEVEGETPQESIGVCIHGGNDWREKHKGLQQDDDCTKSDALLRPILADHLLEPAGHVGTVSESFIQTAVRAAPSAKTLARHNMERDVFL